MICHQRKLLFIHISRTGGTSIETALIGSDWWQVDRETKHLRASQARAAYGASAWESYTTFSVVRNPWDRVVSMWATGWWHEAASLDSSAPFARFIRKLRAHPNERCRTIFYDEILDLDVDYVLRFERLQDDFNLMLDDLGMDRLVLPHVERRSRPAYTTMYGDRERLLLARRFSRDIERFDYEW